MIGETLVGSSLFSGGKIEQIWLPEENTVCHTTSQNLMSDITLVCIVFSSKRDFTAGVMEQFSYMNIIHVLMDSSKIVYTLNSIHSISWHGTVKIHVHTCTFFASLGVCDDGHPKRGREGSWWWCVLILILIPHITYPNTTQFNCSLSTTSNTDCVYVAGLRHASHRSSAVLCALAMSGSGSGSGLSGNTTPQIKTEASLIETATLSKLTGI